MGFLSSAIGNLFGKGTGDVQEAQNQGFDFLKENPLLQQLQDQGGQATGLISGLLGLGGDQNASNAAFDRYKDSTGYKFRLGEGMDAIRDSRAAKGILNSGASSKALMQYGQNIGSQEFSNFLAQLGAAQGAGTNAVNTIGQAGSQAASGVAAAERQGQEDGMSTLGGIAKLGMSFLPF